MFAAAADEFQDPVKHEFSWGGCLDCSMEFPLAFVALRVCLGRVVANLVAGSVYILWALRCGEMCISLLCMLERLHLWQGVSAEEELGV